jgi:hypothetical protein
MNNYEKMLQAMEYHILHYLQNMQKEYGKNWGFRKYQIVKNTGIPMEILTILLRRLKYRGKVELIMIWCEEKGTPNGSGYRLV